MARHYEVVIVTADFLHVLQITEYSSFKFSHLHQQSYTVAG